MIDTSFIHYFLGINVWQDEKRVFNSQKCYMKELLDLFSIKDSCPFTSSMDSNKELIAHNDEDLANATLYKNMTGSLISLLNTRLNLCFMIVFLLDLGLVLPKLIEMQDCRYYNN